MCSSMKTGTIFCLMLEKTSPDFMGDYAEGPNGFKASEVFNFAHFREPANYQKVLTEAEATDIMGNTQPISTFIMKDNFQMLITLTSADEEAFNATIAKIP